MYNTKMEIDTNVVLNDILEQNKQLTLQLSIAKAALSKLQAEYDKVLSEPDKRAIEKPQ